MNYRLAITTQIHENYGAHDWDGNGVCPQYWKAKGGNEYQYPLGDCSSYCELGADGLKKLVDQLKGQIEKHDDYGNEYVINWDVYSECEPTPEEAMLAECLEEGDFSQEEYDRHIAGLQIELVAV